jgi:large subunit ribosomal protein L31e
MMSGSKEAEERIYTVPLGRAYASPKYRRAEKAIAILRGFAERHMKASAVEIDPKVNEAIWSRGIERPPRRLRVRLSRDEEGKVRISLAEEET